MSGRRHSGYRSDLDVRDNGRRGEPLPGCDCERCFGRCMIDRDAAQRAGFGADRDAAGKDREIIKNRKES